MQRLADDGGQITKADFIKLGQDMKLLDFGGGMGEKRKPQTPRKERKKQGGEVGGQVSSAPTG